MKRSTAAAVLLVLAGCAGATPEPDSVAIAGPAAAPAPVAVYELTKQDKTMDCRRLTGRIRVKLAILKSAAGAPKASEPAALAQKAATPIFGGTTRGADSAADMRADRAQIDAFNKRLAELKCPTVDVDAELGKSPAAPAAKAPKASAPKPATPG